MYRPGNSTTFLSIVQARKILTVVNDRKVTTDNVKLYIERFVHGYSWSITLLFSENSGLVQGKMIKRQKIPKQYTQFDFEPPNYTWKDFNLGTTLRFFSKDFIICSCDDFTAVRRSVDRQILPDFESFKL